MIVAMDIVSVTCFVDGASKGNPGPGGWGSVCIFERNDGVFVVQELGASEAHTTNNRMELEAVISTLAFLKNLQKNSQLSQFKVIIVSDSTYVVNGSTQWLDGWKRKGWKTASKDPVLNQELWEQIDEYKQHFGSKLTFEKVKGHAGHEHNERADTIASTFAEGSPVKLRDDIHTLIKN